MSHPNKEESDRMLVLLERAVRRSKLSQRELERRLGLGQGYLGSLFKGRIQLKLLHVYRLAHALDLEPLLLFLQVSPPKDPDWLLGQLGIGKEQLLTFLMNGKRLPNAREMVEIVSAALRAELERLLREAQS
jgi:transcriptional regulator with XRE-family HTH domain